MSGTERPINVCFVGNPNCGKTTLFNAFTGAKLKVANWPGVTVERVEGETSYKGRKIRVIDTPGIYSLTSYTMEELVTRRCIEEDGVDVIVNVVDASSLERNLYLTMQLLELKKPARNGDRSSPSPGDAGLDPGRSGISEKEDRTRCFDACSGTSL